MDISAQELEVILNASNDAIVAINNDCRITLFNAAAERLTGIPASQAIGKPIMDIIPNSHLPLILRTGLPEINQQQTLGDIIIITSRLPILNPRGEIVGAVAMFRDISEMQTLAEEITDLRKIRVMLEAILNSTQDAISVVDEEGRNIYVNPAYTKITGLKEHEVINKPATVDIAEGDSVHFQVLKTRQAVRGVPMKVGPGRREVVVNVAPIIIGDELKGSVGIIHDISELKRLSEELAQARSIIRKLAAKYTFDDIVGYSEVILAAREQALRAAYTPATVLLRGESGTGKELFAHAIHNSSSRQKAKFVRVNCAALAPALLESELFGYEKGAFTGAAREGKIGLFEEADGGTIFLDEIGEMELSLQRKLLRVLQEKEILRVGATIPVTVNVRVIAATNANLEQAIEAKTFREDLYYRLNVIPILIPPLRQRLADIPLLAGHIIHKLNQEFGRSIEGVQPDALKELMSYHWPGNVRELENVIGRAIINMTFHEHHILPRHLPPLKLAGEFPAPKDSVLKSWTQAWQGQDLEHILDAVEREIIPKTLEECQGNKTLAAKKLGISTRHLYNKLQKISRNILHT